MCCRQAVSGILGRTAFRAPASRCERVVMALIRGGIEYTDDARSYDNLDGGLVVTREPRPYQREALDAFRANRYRGVVVLPTGAGKTYVAHMAIDATRRSSLVVAPTLDLVRQWYDGLKVAFGCDVGLWWRGTTTFGRSLCRPMIPLICTWIILATASAS